MEPSIFLQKKSSYKLSILSFKDINLFSLDSFTQKSCQISLLDPPNKYKAKRTSPNDPFPSETSLSWFLLLLRYSGLTPDSFIIASLKDPGLIESNIQKRLPSSPNIKLVPFSISWNFCSWTKISFYFWLINFQFQKQVDLCLKKKN